ncbi:hypothetical protein LHK_01641 [Laribacter hongkongensis HLHK9]|uniref:Uncharacterized protein n=1 Tax=Laribacter hongkongensis (strain HLHK9) TaxID=557598 RepID=C1D837_LARHH|nr:hypothetical protein LHK_01641 [Laribacter hongkongensis HLHK9]
MDGCRLPCRSVVLESIGTKSLGEGAILTGLMQKPIEAFAAAENASSRLNASMLQMGGVASPEFEKMIALKTVGR